MRINVKIYCGVEFEIRGAKHTQSFQIATMSIVINFF